MIANLLVNASKCFSVLVLLSKGSGLWSSQQHKQLPKQTWNLWVVFSLAFKLPTIRSAKIYCIDYLQFRSLSIPSSGVSPCRSNVIAPAQCLWSTNTHPFFHVSTGPSWSPGRGLLWAIDQATHLVVETWHTWEILKGLRGSTWHRTFLHTNTKSCKYDLIFDCIVALWLCGLFHHLRLFARDCGLHLSIF